MDKITLAAARVNAGLRIEDVANIIDKSPSTISSWENYTSSPKILDAIKLCELYKKPIYEIAWVKEDK